MEHLKAFDEVLKYGKFRSLYPLLMEMEGPRLTISSKRIEQHDRPSQHSHSRGVTLSAL